MRVLHVTEAAGSGTFHVVRTLAARLAERGHEIAVAAGRRPVSPADLGAELPATVELHALPWTERTVRAQVAAARALRRLVAAWRPGVVHLHSSFAGALGAVAVP